MLYTESDNVNGKSCDNTEIASENAINPSQNCDNRNAAIITSCITDRLRQSEYWTERTKIRGNSISNLKCPECGDKTAWAYADNPFSINCNRLSNCGVRTRTLSLFPDILRNIEYEHPPTDADPHHPATFYLSTRGLNRSLSGLGYEYWQDVRKTGSGAVMFPIRKSDGETVYNGRLFNPPDGEGKTHNRGGTSGVFWHHPGIEYNFHADTYVTEGIINALSLIEMGKQAIAVLSSGQDPAKANLSYFGHLIFAFDNDPAGRKATQKWKEAYNDPKVKAILPISGDWNDFLIRNGQKKDAKGFDPSIAANEFDSQTSAFEALCDDEKLAKAIKKDEQDAEIFRRIRKLNEKHAVVMLGGKCCVMYETEDPIFDRKDVIFQNVTDFKNFNANDRMFVGNKELGIADIWFRDARRRQYTGVIFNPGADIPGYFNLWRGFCIKPKKGNWDLMKRHIYEVICSKNDEYFTWLMAWLARLVQNPGGERPGTTVVLQGKQGTGKGTLVNQFRYFFGTHFLHVRDQKHLTGNFNYHLKDALLVFCDEGFWAGNKSAEGVLKGLITEPTLLIEPKGRDAFTVKNHVNVIIASNNKWVIPAGLEERRFFVLRVNESRLQDTAYFRAIADQMNDGGREAMFYDLLKLDISGVDLRKAPKTEALIEQIERSMTPLQKWWYGCLNKGENIRDDGLWHESVETTRLYRDYLEFCKETEETKFRLSDTQFGKDLKELCEHIWKEREKTADKDGKRPYFYCFPSLEECRDHFSKEVGYPIRWEE